LRLRILILVLGPGGEEMSGPDMRGWRLARALATRHSVTAVVRRPPPDPPPGVRVVEWRRRTILREALRADSVVAPWVPPWLLAALSRRRTLTVADLYDPIELEMATLEPGPAVARRMRAERLSRELQLTFADVVACASEGQRADLERELRELAPQAGGRPPLVCVPLGVDDDPPPASRRPLRARFPQIGADDPVVLWWGSVWRWLDPETAILAFERVLAEVPRARLVFTTGTPGSERLRELGDAERLRGLAAERGLLGESVLTLDEWVPHDERHELLHEADVGISLHRDPGEAARAARARYLDYLWARLPCVLTDGNETADRFARAGFARTAPVGDAEAVAAALLGLLDPGQRERARAAAEPLAEEMRWDRVAEPLLAALDDPPERRRVRAGPAAAALARYWTVRLRSAW
jgi:glycosyltransferase involved in cell wall biosynthesis